MGERVGDVVGVLDGLSEGAMESDGLDEGMVDGAELKDGAGEGAAEGTSVGALEGGKEGVPVGSPGAGITFPFSSKLIWRSEFPPILLAPLRAEEEEVEEESLLSGRVKARMTARIPDTATTATRAPKIIHILLLKAPLGSDLVDVSSTTEVSEPVEGESFEPASIAVLAGLAGRSLDGRGASSVADILTCPKAWKDHNFKNYDVSNMYGIVTHGT